MAKYTNPLDNIGVASPCSQDWEAMIGDGRKRYCGECKLNVYNLSGMTRDEAENLIQNSEGRLCVRFYRRQDGTVLTQDCPVGWQAVKRRVSRTAAAVASLIIGLMSGLGFSNAISPNKRIKFLPVLTTPTPEPPLMGAIPMPTPTPKATPKTTPSPREFTMGEMVVPRTTPNDKKQKQ